MKTTLKLILVSSILLSIQSCYKRKDTETIKGTITFIDTVNNVGVNGVKYRIYEYKKKIKDTEIIVFLEGKTDQNGKAYFEFERPKNKKKWRYFLAFDMSTVPNNLKYNGSKTNIIYGESFSSGRDEIPLNNVYTEYDNNDVSIFFYP